MNIKDFLNKEKDNYSMFAIGTDTAHIFIGTYEEFKKYISDISANQLLNSVRLSSKYEALINYRKVKGPPVPTEYGSDTDFRVALAKYERDMEYFPRAKKEMDKYIRDYVHFSEREVRDYYRSIVDDDMLIVLIEGPERGKYWLREEFLKDYGGDD